MLKSSLGIYRLLTLLGYILIKTSYAAVVCKGDGVFIVYFNYIKCNAMISVGTLKANAHL